MNGLNALLSKLDINSDIILGVFLLILAVSGNFIAEALSCKTRKFLSDSMYAKNLVIILIVYFSLGLVSDNSVSPTIHLNYTLIIWLFFLIFNKMSLRFTILAFSMLFLILVCKNWIDYYTAIDEKKYKDEIDTMQNMSQYLLLLTFIIIISGFLLYFNKQYKEHSEDFSFMTFIFGAVTCDSS
jgi:hypothetical protein